MTDEQSPKKKVDVKNLPKAGRPVRLPRTRGHAPYRAGRSAAPAARPAK